MKYRVFALMGILALGAGAILHAQDYDDIYYDASKSTAESKTVKVTTPVKTVAVYGEVPDRYKVAAKDNYRVERDEDEYNRRGAAYESDYEVDLNGDTIYEEAFANTRRIERFYNPDIVILSDDDDLVELYYDESPTINLIVGSEWGYSPSYAWASSYYPWYSWGSYYPWYSIWYDPWYSPYYYGWHYPRLWGWSYSPWYYSHWGSHYWWSWGGRPYGWDNWHWTGTGIGSHHGHHSAGYTNHGWRDRGGRVGLASNRNGRSRSGSGISSRNGMTPRGTDGNRGTGVGTSTHSRGGYATGRGGGNMGSRGSSSAGPRNNGSVSRSSGGSRSYSGGSRSSGSYSGGSRSSGSYSGGSRSSGSYSGGSSGGGSRSGGGGGGSHGGSSGGGGHRR